MITIELRKLPSEINYTMRRFLSRSIILHSLLLGFCYVGYWIMGQIFSTDLYTDMSSTKMSFDFDAGRSNDKDFQTAEPSDVLILTYMRSGSTFIGKLLGCRTDTFYWYEPLHKTLLFEYFSEDGQVCSYGKPYCRNVPEPDPKSLEVALNFLLNIYKCNNLMQYYPREPLALAGQERLAGPSGKVFADCKANVLQNCTKCKTTLTRCKNCTTDAENCKPCSRLSLEPCYEKFIDRCPTSVHRVTKVLRMATANAKYLLLQHKRLKLIQIFRDPRATLDSRRRTVWYYRPDHNFTLLQDAMTLCKRMEKDITAAKDLKRLFPDRVKILLYEDFKDPISLGKLLYSFLNMRLTRTARSLLTELSSTGSRTGFHPDSFRYHLDWSTVQHIDKTCHKILRSLGLRTFKSKSEFLNTSFDTVSDSRPYALEG